MLLTPPLPARHHAFTLIELVVTVAIVSLLASVAFPMAEVAIKRTKEQELRTALRQIRESLDAYRQAGEEGRILRKAGESGYPKSLETLVEGVEDVRSPVKTKMFFLRRIPRDPFVADPGIAPEKTWGKRSYASSADDPKEGDDVFDVYSLTPGLGLNGIAYRDW
jgi:general secretion pathway protein G